MKSNRIWKILLFVGFIPFVAPIVLGLYMMRIESWHLFDWVVLYSYVYWPTYVVGMVLIALSGIRLLIGSAKRKENESK